MLYNDENHLSKFLFKNEERIVLHCIKVDLDVYKDSSMDLGKGLLTLLNYYNNKFGFSHFSKFNLEIAELTTLLEHAKFVDSISALLSFHGVSHIILTKQLEQFKTGMEDEFTPETTLFKRELEIISEIATL